jgi:hypothetical protein
MAYLVCNLAEITGGWRKKYKVDTDIDSDPNPEHKHDLGGRSGHRLSNPTKPVVGLACDFGLNKRSRWLR